MAVSDHSMKPPVHSRMNLSVPNETPKRATFQSAFVADRPHLSHISADR